MQKAFDILSGKRPKTGGGKKNEIESLKIGPEGISIKKTEAGRDRSVDTSL